MYFDPTGEYAQCAVWPWGTLSCAGAAANAAYRVYKATRAAAAAAAAASAAAKTKEKEKCEDCDPPEGTICSDFHFGGTPHETKDINGNSTGKQRDHVHIWKMNKAPSGCYWNKMRKETFNYTPINARACSSYPSWVAQQGGRL